MYLSQLFHYLFIIYINLCYLYYVSIMKRNGENNLLNDHTKINHSFWHLFIPNFSSNGFLWVFWKTSCDYIDFYLASLYSFNHFQYNNKVFKHTFWKFRFWKIFININSALINIFMCRSFLEDGINFRFDS